MPTFRNINKAGFEKHNHTRPKGQTGLPMISSMDEMHTLDELLLRHNAIMIIKLHPMQDRSLVGDFSEFSNIQFIEYKNLLKEDIQISQILGYADALISDYSSVSGGYLVLDRPIGFTLDDIDNIETERGFNWPDIKAHLPGEELYSFEEMYEYVELVLTGDDPGLEKRRALTESMQKYKDDQNSKRVLEALGITK